MMAAPPYQDALMKSGYTHQLEFDPNASEPSKKKKLRNMNISWFNPPLNATVRTNVAAGFLKLIDESFPKENPLQKNFN